MKKWHKSDLENRMYVNLEDGKKIAMPRYYKDKIYTKTVTYTTGSGIPMVTLHGEREKIAAAAKITNELKNIEWERDMRARYGDDYIHVKVQADMASFRKMYKDAEKNRGKI